MLHEAESDELEKTRQRCLYIDIESGRAITPAARITELRARELTILAGELMAEILGHFPWEFERMIENVVSFERSIGLSEKKISHRKHASADTAAGNAESRRVGNEAQLDISRAVWPRL